MTLLDEIRLCTDCTKRGLASSNRLNTNQKPCVQFNVEKNWKRDPVSVLFIAESPPWNGRENYFYNPDAIGRQTGLRREVFKYLGIDSLKDFKTEGHFLVDTIKCRLNKSRKEKSPLRLYQIAEKCSGRFLHREVIALKPRTIFILGNTAKRAIERFPEFEELKNHRVTNDFEANLSGYRIVLCPFPGGLTRGLVKEIDNAFRKIRQS